MGLRIVFMGSPEFAVPTLEQIHFSNHSIVGVITGEDKRRSRGNQTSPTPVKQKAVSLGLPVYSFESMKNPELEMILTELHPDLIVIVAFKILPSSIIAIPKFGAVNIHASLLPKYRGAAPIHHAVLNGDKETGISIFFLNNGIDTGSILLQKKVPIFDNETTGEVYQKLMKLGSIAILEALNTIESKNYQTIHQDETLATAAPKLFTEQAHIDFHKTAFEVHNQIRAMNPHPGSWIWWDSKKMKLKYSSVSSIHNATKQPGEWFIENNQLHIQCNQDSIIVHQLQIEGKSETDAISFLNGYRDSGIIS